VQQPSSLQRRVQWDLQWKRGRYGREWSAACDCSVRVDFYFMKRKRKDKKTDLIEVNFNMTSDLLYINHKYLISN
jgi:hypothetical protein